jgi:hypothetical protein
LTPSAERQTACTTDGAVSRQPGFAESSWVSAQTTTTSRSEVITESCDQYPMPGCWVSFTAGANGAPS